MLTGIKTEFYILIFGTSASAFAKLSTLHLYLRVFEKPIKRYVILLNLLVSLWVVAFVCLLIFRCRPITDMWPTPLNQANVLPDGLPELDLSDLDRCISPTIISKALGGSDVATDLIILTLPIPFVMELQMRPKRKLAVTIVLLLGTL